MHRVGIGWEVCFKMCDRYYDVLPVDSLCIEIDGDNWLLLNFRDTRSSPSLKYILALLSVEP